MKIALCLHGIVGTTDKYGSGVKPIPPEIGFKHFKKHVMDTNDEVDVFIHTWSQDQHDHLNQLYSPVNMVSEGQPQFIKKQELREIAKQSMKDPTWIPTARQNIDRKQAIYCRWKSTQSVLNLVKESGKQYDYVLLTRFDIAFLVDFVFKDYDPEKFYAQGPAGVLKNGVNLINDLWYFANQENMMKFSTLFDNLENEKYIPHIDSNHELARRHLIETGLSEKIEYIFKRNWTGSPGKVLTDTPLVRWFYDEFLDESILDPNGNIIKLLTDKRAKYAASNSS